MNTPLDNRRSGAARRQRFAMPARRGVSGSPVRLRRRGLFAGGAPSGPNPASRPRPLVAEPCPADEGRLGNDSPRRGLAYAAVTVAILLLVWESIAIAHGLALLFGR